MVDDTPRHQVQKVCKLLRSYSIKINRQKMNPQVY